MIVQSAAEIDSALDAEAWASHLLGTFREQRHGLPFPDAVEVDPALLFGEPLVTRLATFERPGRHGRAGVDRGARRRQPGRLGGGAARRLDAGGRRSAVDRADRDSEIVGAAVISESVFDDARRSCSRAATPNGETMAVGVLIDRNLGGLAKDVLLAESIEQVRAQWAGTRLATRLSWSSSRSSPASLPG